MLMQRAAIAAAGFGPGRTSIAVRSNFRPSALASLRRHNDKCWMSTVEVPPPPTSHHPHTNLPNAQGTIIYTETDEAPALATYSLYPAVNKIGALAGIDIVPCDVSLA